MAVNKQNFFDTMDDVMKFMAPLAGGAIPTAGSDEYMTWVMWIGQKIHEDSYRGFWRRLLTKTTLTLEADEETCLLPDNFQKINGIYVFDVNGVDWNEPGNDDGQTLFVEVSSDIEDPDYGKWRVRFSSAPTEEKTATIWYFFAPAVPVEPADKIVLPGDMIAFGALVEYFRQAGAEGSQDDARDEHENRFTSYLSLEVLPNKQELLSWSTRFGKRNDIVATAKNYYRSRDRRYRG